MKPLKDYIEQTNDAFEKASPDQKRVMIAICNNIIQNNGTFNP